MSRFTLTSPSFEGLGHIGREHTCDGNDTPPLLEWSHAPGGTRSFVLIMEDLDADAGPVTHWLVWDIPGAEDSLDPMQPEAAGVHGRNDFHVAGYRGPCPPRSGREHRYRFTLIALDVASLELAPGVYRGAVERAMADHVLGTAELIGRYARGPVTRGR